MRLAVAALLLCGCAATPLPGGYGTQLVSASRDLGNLADRVSTVCCKDESESERRERLLRDGLVLSAFDIPPAVFYAEDSERLQRCVLQPAWAVLETASYQYEVSGQTDQRALQTASTAATTLRRVLQTLDAGGIDCE